MPNLLSLESLESDRAFVQRQREKASADRWGTSKTMWDQRLSDINQKIDEIKTKPASHASVALIFDGLPVVGQGDIRLDFSTEVLSSYQKIIAAALASQTDHEIAAKGRVRGADKSKLFIRDIVRGSMGFILEELAVPQTDMFATPLKNAVEEATQLIGALNSATEQQFAETIDAAPPRLVGALQKFTRVLQDAGATARIVGDQHRVALGLEEIHRLSHRFSEVDVADEEMTIQGVLLGILPDSREFELQLPDDAGTMKGSVSEDLAARYLTDSAFKERLLLRPVTAQLTLTRTMRVGRTIKQQIVLNSLGLRAQEDLPTYGDRGTEAGADPQE
ncbi:hypothetical protein HF265_00450 [Rhizobium leguminosarum]|uniref:hypothetical protein n=1 Tax=Rhizobium leguminosarum TaxID=384 RepID=UPI00102FE0AF|nr:hypothetical protein [Rhizobium leguminosarum]MBY3027591.1 hypothetical protein [Rhizobium leguminosarum]TBF41485.1 hypothetical protein ELG92_16120 [Rhizobium leguminosarum]